MGTQKTKPALAGRTSAGRTSAGRTNQLSKPKRGAKSARTVPPEPVVVARTATRESPQRTAPPRMGASADAPAALNWLFLRGLAREQRHWGGFAKIFTDMVPGSRVHFLDLPGAGTELKRRSPLSIAGMREDLRTRWEKLRDRDAAATRAGTAARTTKLDAPRAVPATGPHPSPAPWALLSISLGGMVALDWAANYANDFAGVVVINSSARNLSAPWERLNWKILVSLLKLLPQRDLVQRERAILMLTTRIRGEELDRVAVEWASYACAPKIMRDTALRQLAAATAFACPRQLPVPSLVLSSLRDRFTSQRCSMAIAARLKSAHSVHPEAGHDIPLDDPRWVADQIRTWLESSGVGARAATVAKV